MFILPFPPLNQWLKRLHKQKYPSGAQRVGLCPRSKSNLVFSGDMRLKKTLCSGEIGRQFRRNRTLFPLHPPHKSPWTFVRAFATAGFPPIRNKTGWLRPPGFYSSLRSNQAATGAVHFFIITPRSPPQRLTSLRLGTNLAGHSPP